MTETCRNGHPRTPENTYTQPGTGWRSCRVCRQVSYKANRTKIAAYSKQWQADNRPQQRDNRRASMLRKYGLEVADYDRMFESQDGRCYICQRTPKQRKRLCVDHNHRTGEVRGLLCDYCNSTLGFMHENITWFQRAADYLTNPPSRQVFDTPKRHVNAPPLASSRSVVQTDRPTQETDRA